MMAEQDVGRPRESRRRSVLELHLDVLRVIRDGTRKPTHIMYGANLSWNPMHRILRSLVSQGLIREVDVSGDRDGRSSRSYEITRKGEKVVGYINRSVELMGIDY